MAAQSGRRERLRARRQLGQGAALVALASLAFPLFSRMLQMSWPAMTLTLPSLVLVAGAAMLCPRWFIPPATLAGMYAFDRLLAAARGYGIGPTLPQALLAGQVQLLWVPAAALAAGWLLTYARLRWQPRLLPASMRTNLAILGRRPGLFARKYWLGLSALAIGAALDMLTTIDFMRKGGTDLEVHPAMRMMAEVFGVDPGVVLGTLARLALAVFVAAIWRKATTALLVLCGVLYLLAGLSNQFDWLSVAVGWLRSIFGRP